MGDSFVEWPADFECSAEDLDYWDNWWCQNPPLWLESLGSYLAETGRS